MADHRIAIEQQAIDWVIRQRDAAFDDWTGFEAWLAADATHAQVYAEVALADEDVAALLAQSPAKLPVFRTMPGTARTARSRTWLRGAVAAVVVAVAAVAVWQQQPDRYGIESPAGSRREVVLSDGTKLQMNGGTRLVLDRHHPRDVRVDRGEVLFTVAHDAAHPFRVQVADTTLLDVGTVFNVVRSQGVMRVAVAEGAVLFNPDGEAIRLAAGRSLVNRDGAGRVELGDVSPASVGAWQDGRLVYDGATLAEVAADLSRNLGVRVTVDQSLADRPFRGVISLDVGRTSVAKLGPLLDVRVVPESGGWRLAARTP